MLRRRRKPPPPALTGNCPIREHTAVGHGRGERRARAVVLSVFAITGSLGSSVAAAAIAGTAPPAGVTAAFVVLAGAICAAAVAYGIVARNYAFAVAAALLCLVIFAVAV